MAEIDQKAELFKQKKDEQSDVSNSKPAEDATEEEKANFEANKAKKLEELKVERKTISDEILALQTRIEAYNTQFAGYTSLVSNLTETLQNYANQAQYKQTGYHVVQDGKNSFVYQFSNINAAGNYDAEAWFKNYINSYAQTAHKPITTYGEYWAQGPFFGMFVEPVNLFMHAIIKGLGTTGWSIIFALIVTVIIVRLISFGVSFKSLFSQAKMEEFNRKKAKIEAKYAPYKGDKQMMQRKQMEISELYKKEKISPWGQMITMFITLPILIVVFRIISASPEIKQATWYGIQLSATSISRVMNKEFAYLPIILVSVAVQAVAQYTPKMLKWKRKKSLRADAYERAAMKKENRKGNIIALIFIGIGVMFSAGLQIYWIIGGIWTIAQHLFVHYFQRTKYFKNKIEPKL
ncbi:membrane protein insertase YidC [[Mycoplasma] falconis]|uniref:Membrane protein insertase YidC n=2 Tax=[Mycoplasma] falconis TaxID=92403 RepID=A0A501X8D3_9BACT|nr:membrane protein insertase YidC [[Mycoplasma] falconis]